MFRKFNSLIFPLWIWFRNTVFQGNIAQFSLYIPYVKKGQDFLDKRSLITLITDRYESQKKRGIHQVYLSRFDALY